MHPGYMKACTFQKVKGDKCHSEHFVPQMYEYGGMILKQLEICFLRKYVK